MTAEIIVANKSGIAIAADSAVTVERFHEGKLKEKVYNSANKLFMLSKHEPIGVMIYNTTTLGGVPWETIIKTFRKELCQQKYDTVDEYASHFFDKIQNDERLFPDSSVNPIIFVNALRIILDLYEGRTKGSFRSRLDEKIEEYEKLDFIKDWDETFLKKVVNTYSSQIKRAFEIAVPISSHRSGCAKKIQRLIGLAFTKKARLRGYSGLVVCGFGEKEVFPQLVEYITDIVVCGRIRHWVERKRSVTGDDPSFVVPFADTAVIRTIMEGINPQFKSSLIRELLGVMVELPKEILKPISQLNDDEKKSYNDAAMGSVIGSLSTLLKKVNEITENSYMEPIKQTLRVLPIGDLAVVSETLINASQIHKRMNPEVESVGGPIDVAVISKGDGFVWIKRKHYFEAELNPGFIKKYLD